MKKKFRLSLLGVRSLLLMLVLISSGSLSVWADSSQGPQSTQSTDPIQQSSSCTYVWIPLVGWVHACW